MSTELQMHGGYGYCSDYRVERLMRDAKITQIWEGTNQVHRQLIGRSFAAKPCDYVDPAPIENESQCRRCKAVQIVA